MTANAAQRDGLISSFTLMVTIDDGDMMATIKWGKPRRWGGWLLVLLVTRILAGAADLSPEGLDRRFGEACQAARERFRTNTNDVTAAWELGRACFDWAELARTDARRAALGRDGVAACRHALGLDPQCAPAQYYLGLNLGQVARTKLLGALKLVGEMEAAWLAAIALDPKFNYAGPHRSLGRLYLEAPGWPVSLGDRAKARQHLEQAVKLAPDYPDNQLAWIEALLKWGERKTVRARLEPVGRILDTARQKYSGERWALDWQEWDLLWRSIQARANPPKAESPRQKE